MNKRDYLKAYAEQLELDAVYCRRAGSQVHYSTGAKRENLRAYWDSKAANLEEKAQKAREELRRLLP